VRLSMKWKVEARGALCSPLSPLPAWFSPVCCSLSLNQRAELKGLLNPSEMPVPAHNAVPANSLWNAVPIGPKRSRNIAPILLDTRVSYALSSFPFISFSAHSSNAARCSVKYPEKL
jgi:hypothetical protein